MIDWTPIAASIATGTAVLVGTGLGTWLNAKNTRAQTRHTERLETAGALVAKIRGTIHSLEYAIDHPDDEGARTNTQHHLGQSSDLLGPVMLLFDDTTIRHAEITSSSLSSAIDALEDRGMAEAMKHLKAARAAQREFIARARGAIEDD